MNYKEFKDKQDRLKIANRFIQIISSHGRRFFHYKGDVAYFKMKRGHIYFVDDYTKKEIYLSYRYWTFSHGGTMRQLVNRLADFIRGAKELPLGMLGPWRETLCGGDLWGYGEDMEKVRQECRELQDFDARTGEWKN